MEGRVAVVTGGSRGIGRATCLLLASKGVHVVVNYLKDEGAARSVLEEAKRKGVESLALRGDVSKLAEAEGIVSRTCEHFGRLDVLVCSAGVWEGAPLELMTEELWDRVLDINLKGTWAACRAAVPQMKRQREGRIVLVSSTAGQRGEAGYSNYAASKGGQISLMKSLALELAPWGVNVNAVAPGWVLTEMVAEEFADENSRREIEREIPRGRVAEASDIACSIVFLCSDWARHITGQVLNVNGGSVLCG
jgi:3-oxoacyl-[acyl-carrier protein] reductase